MGKTYYGFSDAKSQEYMRQVKFFSAPKEGSENKTERSQP
jgi:hypothetical protein